MASTNVRIFSGARFTVFYVVQTRNNVASCEVGGVLYDSCIVHDSLVEIVDLPLSYIYIYIYD